MNIEDQISELNEFYFFREFTYSENKFIKNDGQEVEIADNIVFLDNIFIIYQIKTRKLIEKATPCRFFNFSPLKISRFKTGILNCNRKAGRVCLPALIL
jgi:hypothetical protein